MKINFTNNYYFKCKRRKSVGIYYLYSNLIDVFHLIGQGIIAMTILIKNKRKFLNSCNKYDII